MEIRLLGPLEVRDGAQVVTLPRRQQRALLAALALKAGEVISTDRLVADLWGERAPASATGSLQNTVSALRKALGRGVVVTQAPGYRLALDRESVDAHRFERLLAAARGCDEAARAPLLDEALALWRGPALADLDDERFARLEAARLDELRVAAQEERIDAELALGRHASLVGELETLVATHPLRERLRGQLMLTLYRCGRQAEALEVYRAARLALADELGLDPSPELQELERKVLRQDPSLDAPATAEAASVHRAAERRLVTVLAATPPADDDPERHRALLDETLASVHDALARYGGALERFGPEGLVAVFGADAPSDDDAQRALAAAEELGLAAGIATGEVVGGAGSVVTRAVGLARSNGISLDERTQALVSQTRRLVDVPLVGRGEELARLTAALGESGCRVLTVFGEPGIGKTRLARELALHAGEGTTLLVARCAAHGQGSTFLPLLGAIGRAEPEAALAGADDAELVLGRLAALAGGDDRATLGESYWAVRRLLESLAPTLLVLDDVHWAEPALLDLVDYLGERLQGDALILCLTRPELERRLGETIRLGPLSTEDARELVPHALGEDARERIVALAEGNPLYVEQLSSYATEGGEGLPPTLEAVLASRIGRLSHVERAVAQRAAVVGREFSRGAVAFLSDGPVDGALASLSRRRFVHPAAAADAGDDGYAFHHVLLRDAAYVTLTKADRAALHERAAAWLDRDGPGDDAVAGWHLEQAYGARRAAGLDDDATAELGRRAAERLGVAGTRAVHAGAMAEGKALLTRVVRDLPTSASERPRLLIELATAVEGVGDPAAAAELAAMALDEATLARQPVTTARAQLVLASIRFSLAPAQALPELLATIDAAMPLLERNRADEIMATAWRLRGHAHRVACQFTSQQEALERALEHARRAGSRRETQEIASWLGWPLYLGATPTDVALARGRALLEETGPSTVAEGSLGAFVAVFHAMRGDFDAAHARVRSSRRVLEELGFKNRAVFRAPIWSEVWLLDGDGLAAERELRPVWDMLSGGRQQAVGALVAAALARAVEAQGRLDEAENIARSALGLAPQSDTWLQSTTRVSLARVLVRLGRLEEAERTARDAVALVTGTDALLLRADALAVLGEALRAAGGNDGDADDAFRNALELYERKGHLVAARRLRSTVAVATG